MIVFIVRDGRTVRKSIDKTPMIGRTLTGHGEIWKIERDQHKNVVVHCR